MNDQLSINGSIKDNLFNKLKNNKTVKHLEISYGNVDDDWYLIGELNQLVSLSIKDSFIDFHSFYGALATLKNLEQITYNYYCFFNKQKNDQLKNSIINIKTFQIDLPKDDEPDFDFNNYLKMCYENEPTLNKSNIIVSSIHGVKGMERKKVILSNDWGYSFFNYHSGIVKREEEELRCCYVAVTRAQEELYILDNGPVKTKFPYLIL